MNQVGQGSLQQILEKEYFQSPYLEEFQFDWQFESSPKITAIIPTYNRCPNRSNVQCNPIWWAANSLFTQPNLGEIVFVNDGSNDYFLETVEEIRKRSPTNVDVNYVHYKERKGSGESRNIGVRAAKYDYLFFMDDDCIILGEEVLPKLYKAFNLLRQEGVGVGAMTMPVSASSLEHEIFPASQIGKVDKEKGIAHGVYRRFPEEYLENPNYIDKNKNIFRPLEVESSGGVFLGHKKAYLEGGGFPTTKWRNASTEEAEFTLNMRKRGYKAFYLPSLDEKFSVFHFKYGNPSLERFNGNPYPFLIEGISAKEMIKESLKERLGCGNRVTPGEETYSNILSKIKLMFEWYGNSAGLRYLETTYSETKDNGGLEFFKKAVQDGLDIMREEEMLPSKISKEIKQRYLTK